MNIFGDKEGVKAIEDNPSSASRSNHIDAKIRSIRGLIQEGEVCVMNVGTEEKPYMFSRSPSGGRNFCRTPESS